MKKLLPLLLFVSTNLMSNDINCREEYDKQKQWMISTIFSFKYLERMVIEYDNDIQGAISEMISRSQRLNKSYIFKPKDEIENHTKGGNAYYDFQNTFLPSVYEGPTIGIHEFEHQITYGDFYLSDYAKNLYKSAFDSSSVSNFMILKNRTSINYYSDPTELDAEKKQLEFELDRLGIKKYEEEFTMVHYKKILYGITRGLFISGGAVSFIKHIKHSCIIKIMNTIA